MIELSGCLVAWDERGCQWSRVELGQGFPGVGRGFGVGGCVDGWIDGQAEAKL